jgi:hypothetical protein
LAGETVTVACKLPSGLHLRVNGQTVTLRGCGHTFGNAPPGAASGGYALTPNVPLDFWEAWLAINADSDVVRKGVVFSASKTVDARARAVEQAAVRSGFEGVNPQAPGDGLTQVLVGGG